MKLYCLVFVTALAVAGAASVSFAETLAADSRLVVEVVDPSTGRPVTADRYVAVVGVDKPWREPAAEALIPAGEPSPTFQVPPGLYRLDCGAAGFSLRVETPVELESGQPVSVRCRPAALASARGRLIAAGSDTPVAGAFVAPRVLFEEESPLRLSTTGMIFAAETFGARSDAEGFFEVSGEQLTSTELWVEADGFAARSLGVVEFTAPANDLGDIRLQPGGAVVIAVRPPPGFPQNDYLIAVRPPTAGPDRMGATGEYQALMRPMSGPDPVRYPGLAPGQYQVWLKPRVRSGKSELPRTLGTVDVRRGENVTLEVELPEPEHPALEDVGVITLFSPNLALGSVRDPMFHLWRGNRREEVPAVLEEVSGGLRARLSTSCSDALRVQLLADGLVSPAVAISPEECATALVKDVQMHPAARLRGTVKVPTGFRKPEMAEFAVVACDQSARAAKPPFFPFPIAPSGDWIATVPAGCIDVSLMSAGFAPREVAGLDLVPREERQIGVQRLVPGAVLLVHCFDGSDGLPAAGVEVDVLSEDDSATAIAASFRQQKIPSVVHATTNEQGWVRFEGLAAGTYRVRAIAEVGAITFSPPMALESAVESVVEVEIPPPGAVEVFVDRGGLAAAEDERTTVLATGAGDCDWLADVIIERAVEVPGSTLFEGLPPGRWSFALHLRGPGGTFQLAEESVELLPGGLSHLTLAATGHVFAGEITWLGEPVEAPFRLRSRADEDYGRTVAATRSREDGEFRLVLTEPGTYDVEVRIQGEGASIAPEVSFEDPDERIEVKLGGGTIEGVVVNEDGGPVAGAALHARSVAGSDRPGQEVTRRAGADGSFRIERLSPGRWQLRATADRSQSDLEEIQLENQQIRGGVVLTVEEGVALQGRVSSGGRPLAGATGWVTCLWTSPQNLCGGVFRIEANGEFEIPLGGAPEGAQVNILLDGAAPLDAFREVVGDGDVELSIAGVGGRVTLNGRDQPLTSQRITRMLLVNDRGGVVPGARGIVVEPGTPDDQGSALLFPNLAPGIWRLFEAASQIEFELLLRNGGNGIPAGAVFEVSPGTSVEVSLESE